jgi:hypothetical protein
MSLPGYDAWKLANPYDTTPEQEREAEERHADQMDRLRDAIACALADERGDLYRADVRRIVIEELNKIPRLVGEPKWQTATPVPVPPLG